MRPHQPAHQGLARPRRPVGQGARHVRPPGADRRDRAAPPGRCSRARLVIERPASADEMTLLVETGRAGRGRRAIAETVQAVTKLRSAVDRVAARQPAAGRQADRGSPADRLRFGSNSSNRPNFFKAMSQFGGPYVVWVRFSPYRFVPQTSHPADLIGREPRGSGTPPPEPPFLSGAWPVIGPSRRRRWRRG